MKRIVYICALLAYIFPITQDIHAQKTTYTDISSEIDKIKNIKPGHTLKPENTQKWTDDMFRQWEEAVKKANDEKVKPVEKTKVKIPDFSNMTEEQITSWEDSVLNLLYPRLEVVTSNKPGGEKTIPGADIEMNRTNEPVTNLRSGYTNSYVPTSASINKNYAVGEIGYSSSLLPNGALTYTVPVDVYPGINSHQPNLSVSYNSLAGNGVMGVGWNIGGLSSISRTGKSIYYDTKTEGLLMDKNDPFVLDGMRLIKLGEGSDQIDYETERDHIKVKAYLSGTNVRYFKVWYPNGTVGTYGDANNIYNSYLSFPLTQSTDRFNNTITYTYGYWNNQYTITGINYGNASLQFNYSTSRPDGPFYYQGGLKVQEQRLLTSIDCKFGSSVLRTYGFTYTVQQNQSVLNQISLISGGTYVNPLKFYYGQNNQAYVYTNSQTQLLEWYNFTTPDQIRATRGKFDYGSEDDGVIIAPNYPHYYNETRSSNMFRHSRNRYVNQYDGTEKIFLYTGLNNSDNFADPMPHLYTEEGFIDIFCTNLDGKNEDEVVKINNTRVDNTNEKVTFKVYQGNLYSGLGLTYTRTFNFATVIRDNDDGYSIHPKFYHAGDFNGDGKTEIFAVSCDKPGGQNDKTSKCYLFDLESGVKRFEAYVFPYVVDFVGTSQQNGTAASENTDRLFVLDYNGDGKSDICIINNTGTHIYTFDISGSTYSMRKVASYSGITKSGLAGRQLLFGDFNGDSKLDLLVSPVRDQTDYTWATHFSKGNGQFEKQTFSGTRYYEDYKYYTQDVNSDGITDLMVFMGSGFNTYLMNSAGTPTLDSYTTYHSDAINAVIIPTDINNRNYFGRLVCVKGGFATKYAYPRNDTKERLLTGVINSFGVIEKNHYQKLNETDAYGSWFYSRGSGAVYPYLNIQGPLNVPVSREQYYNNQLHGDINFRYENAVVHNQGLGFCGFSRITTYDNISGRTSVQTYDPYRFGLMMTDENFAAKTTNTYSVNIQSNKIAQITLTGKTLQDKMKGITQTVSYTYDTYGNPTGETISFGDNITQTTSNTYYNNTGTPYILGAVTDQTVTITRNSASNSKRKQVSSHHYGIPLTVIAYANNNKISETVYTYNNQGLVLSESIKPYSSSNVLTTTYAYDAYGRVTKETDPLGLYTTSEYNASTGVLYRTLNHKSQAMTYSYDNLWRRIQTTHPAGVVESTSFAWSSGVGLFSMTASITGQPSSTTCFDTFKRDIRTSTVRYNGTVLHTDKTYDSYGRPYRESLPFSGSNPSYWNTTTFDAYDRPVTVAYASGKRITYSYNGKNITTVENGISTTHYHDAQGNLTSVSDPAGTTYYYLRPDGQPTGIVAPGSITTSFFYDSYGRQIGINDPSAGTRSFVYDAAGNLQQETDANNRRKTMSYDQYGRVTSKTLPEFTTTYGYNSDGQLASETSTNGTSRTYQYDAYGRLYKDRDNGPDSKWLEKTYSYSGGNVYGIQFSSQSGSIGTEYYTYSNGHLSEIKLGTTSIWKLNGENTLGIPTSSITGPITRTYLYDAYGTPTGRSANSSSGGTFQNHTYSFDITKGNLTYRKDNRYNRQENFGYDNLNRLTSYAGNTISYDIKGNITAKNDVGNTFSYNIPNKPYAISAVDAGTNTAIPQRAQSVTYTSFERPASISENGYEATLTYDGAGERKKMQLRQNGGTIYTRYYLGGRYELDAGTSLNKQKLYLGGDAYSAPAVYVNTGSSWQLYYICRDYLGSITHLMNGNGTVAYEYSYDAWGRLRNPSTQQVYLPGSEPALFLDRGYTGHEHLTQFGLVNMNARLYDPAVGRFLSPDPYIQSPDFSQNYNRYSYAYNNPLVYTDPNGELAWFYWVGAAIVGGVSNLIANWNNIDGFWQGVASFGIGAGAAVGIVASGGTGAGALVGVGAAGGAAVGATNSVVAQTGHNFSGMNNVNWGQVGINSAVGGVAGAAGAGAGIAASNMSFLVNGISSPVLRSAVISPLSAGAGHVAGGTTANLFAGQNLGDAFINSFEGIGQNMAIGGALGVTSTVVYSYANRVSPWTGERLHRHHSNPKFMGGDPDQSLTQMSESRHRQLHKDLNDYLYEQKNAVGNHMRPQRGNPGWKIQENFTPQQRIDVMKSFYDTYKWTYPNVRYDFYKNTDTRWWIW